MGPRVVRYAAFESAEAPPDMETNAIRQTIEDLRDRSESLRGYL